MARKKISKNADKSGDKDFSVCKHLRMRTLHKGYREPDDEKSCFPIENDAEAKVLEVSRGRMNCIHKDDVCVDDTAEEKEKESKLNEKSVEVQTIDEKEKGTHV